MINNIVLFIKKNLLTLRPLVMCLTPLRLPYTWVRTMTLWPRPRRHCDNWKICSSTPPTLGQKKSDTMLKERKVTQMYTQQFSDKVPDLSDVIQSDVALSGSLVSKSKQRLTNLQIFWQDRACKPPCYLSSKRISDQVLPHH